VDSRFVENPPDFFECGGRFSIFEKDAIWNLVFDAHAKKKTKKKQIHHGILLGVKTEPIPRCPFRSVTVYST
jgi:hypothetical protein